MTGGVLRGFLRLFVLYTILYTTFFFVRVLGVQKKESDMHYTSLRYTCRFRDCVKACISDAAGFNVKLFSLDTVKVIMAAMPLYYAARRFDEPLHRCFYCADTHTNVCCRPSWCKHTCDEGIIALCTGLSLLSFYPYNDELSTTARVFLFTLPFTWLGKNLLKKLEFHGCERPKNGCFQNRVYYGGFPSGHMAESVYAATLFGLRFGPKWGVPLGLFSVAIATDFVISNRHFASQLVAGSALGVIFGISANKVLERRFGNGYPWRCSCDVGYKNGKPEMAVSYKF